MKNYIAIIASSILIFAGCKKDGCNQPLAFNYDPEGTTSETCVYQPLEVRVAVKVVYGEQEVNAGNNTTSLVTDDGRSLEFTHIGAYLTGFAFVDNGNSVSLGTSGGTCLETVDETLLLLDTNRLFRGAYLPKVTSDITALRFNLGVESCRNDSLDPTTQLSGPFAPQVPTMYWSWATGYRFLTLEGNVDASPAADGSEIKPFEYHTGMNSLLRSVELPIDAIEANGNVVNITMVVDLKKVLENVDFTTELVTHTMNNMPLATKITDNAANSFQVE